MKIANLAQIVNVIAPLLTRGDDLLVQSIFHPFAMMARRRDGVSLRVAVDGPSYEGRTNGRVPFVDASAILGEGVLHVFLINRSERAAAPVSIEPAGSRSRRSRPPRSSPAPGRRPRTASSIPTSWPPARSTRSRCGRGGHA